MARGPRGRRRPSRPLGRRPWLLLATAVLALGAGLGPLGAGSVAAAGDALSVTTAATYTIQPAKRVVAVVVDLTATNNKPNTTSGGIVTRYFYQSARIAIQTEARNIRATAGGSRVSTTVNPADGYAVLETRFAGDLFYHQTTKVRITFELPGGPPRSKSDIRVGSAFATFVAWAFGDSGSVRVVVPAGFDATTTGSALTRSTAGGSTVFRSGAVTDVGTWYAVVNADRPAGLASARIDLPDGEHVVVRGWPEDPEWRRRVATLLTKGLPELVALVGLDWPVSGDLQVFEVHTPLLEGYSGLTFEHQDRIEISEDLDDLTIIHEASHSWFNGDLFQDRWLKEGFADTYASRTLDAIGTDHLTPPAVSRTDPAAVPLAEWTFPGRITDTDTGARETYGYNASWTVIRSILGEIGVERMQAVLQAARAGQIAYVGAGEPETTAGPVDWQHFLDLVDEVGGSTTADELFGQWVIGEQDHEAFAARTTGRTAYAGLVDAGHGWLPPAYVRVPMSSWDFAEAGRRIPFAEAVLTTRDQIASLVAPLGLDVPTDLRAAYEMATDSLATVQARADAELVAARSLVAADAADHGPRGLLTTIGLIGASPDAALDAARAAFLAGAADATSRAQAVSALVGGAAAVGQARVGAMIGAIVVLAFLIVLAAVLVRRRRRHATAVGWTGPYATLPDQSAEKDDTVIDDRQGG